MKALDRVTALYLLASVAIVAGFLLGLVALTPVQDRTGLLSAVAAPVGSFAALIATIIVGKLTARQNQTLRQIESNTNGLLDDRMHEVVATQLDARAIPVVNPDLIRPDDPGPAR